MVRRRIEHSNGRLVKTGLEQHMVGLAVQVGQWHAEFGTNVIVES